MPHPPIERHEQFGIGGDGHYLDPKNEVQREMQQRWFQVGREYDVATFLNICTNMSNYYERAGKKESAEELRVWSGKVRKAQIVAQSLQLIMCLKVKYDENDGEYSLVIIMNDTQR